jgi:hypothetical protein
MALAQAGLIAQHRAFLIWGAEGEVCRRNLEGIDFAVG